MSPGRLRSTVVVFLTCLTVLAASWPMRAIADDESGVVLKKTVTAATITPNVTLSLAFAAGQADAIPGDPITYTSTLANTGATVGISGQIVQGYHGVVEDSHSAPSASVVAYWDVVSTSAPREEGGCSSSEDGSEDSSDARWTPLAGQAASDPTWKVIVPAPISTGMILTATGVPNPKVTFPAAGDPFLGTVITNTTAHWNYQAALQLTPAQVSFLLDKKKVCAIRNTFHLELKPGVAPTTDGTDDRSHSLKPSTSSVRFSSKLLVKTNNGDLKAASITITPPSGTATVFNSGSTPALADIAPGASVTVTLRFPVPVVAPRGALELEADYLTRLRAADKAALKATATAAGTGSSGPVTIAAPPVTTTEHVPVLGIMKTGPATIDAGTTETNPLAISNSGTAPASTLAVLDSVPGGAAGIVSGLPTILAPATVATASAAFPIPIAQPAGPLTDTAALSWADANGNPYGPVSSSFTTAVHNNFFGASLTLTPAVAGPNKPGTTQTLTAKLLDKAGIPMANQPLTFTVTGVNPGSGSATTDSTGMATFAYTGNNAGNDVAQVSVNVPGVSLASNTSSISWVLLLQPVAMTPVTGNFFTNTSSTGPSCAFLPGPGTTPVFSQQFPDILFNPATAQVPHNISGITQTTRPFTDLTTDVNGNYNGTIAAQDQAGNQAGLGPLANFYSELTGSFVIQQAGDVSLTITHSDGYLLGVGGGATRVSGAFEGNPPATTPFNSYPTVAAFNMASPVPASDHDSIHFPAPGVYPFEIDYTQCGLSALTLVIQLATFNAQNSPLSVYVGYADGLRGPGSIFPFPWDGSPDVTFVGGGQMDSGAIRFDNSGDTPINIDTVTVDVASNARYDIWPHSTMVVPPHKILILAQTFATNFDSSDVNGTGCNQNSGIKPVVHVTSGTTTTNFTDSQQVLNTFGFDSVCLGNESESWVRIGGGGTAINVPLPPAGTLNLTPFNVPNAIQGQPLALTVAAMDGSGNAVANLPITLQVYGANARTLNANSDATGLAHFTYTGVSGKDTLIATGFVSGLREVSNTGTVTWAPPVGGGPNPNPDPNAPPAPTIGPLSIADGSIVTKPVTVSATVTPPAGQTITSWRVFYIALDPGPLVVIGSGTGAPPAPPAALATFDPTVLVNDGYSITVEATASNNGIQDATTSVTVLGNLKPGRYTTTYQDLSVPVNGFQMEVRRTYDSIDKSNGDFGVGWRVSVSNFRTAPNRILGAGGWTQYSKSCTLGLCFTAFKNSAPRFVTVTFPDQHTEVFDFTPTGGTNLFWECGPAFTARASIGTNSTLQSVDETTCSYTGDGNLYGSNGPFAPKRFQLTTHGGQVFVLDTSLGLVSENDRNGNTVTIDSSGLHSSSGGSISFSRDGSGRITQVSGPGGQVVAYTYSSAGDLASVTDPNLNLTTFRYDSQHGLLGSSGPGGPLQTLQYDSAGRLVAYTDGAGNVTHVSNDVAGQQQVVLDATGALTTVYTMDDLGDVVRTDRTFGGQTLTSTAAFDSVGRALSRTDPLGNTIVGTYDGDGNLLSFTDPAGANSHSAYDAFGAISALTDELGNATSLQYDSNGNVASVTNPLGKVTTVVHDAAGHKTAVTDPLGSTTRHTYDSAGHETSMTDPLGQTTNFSYDAGGRLTSMRNPLGATSSFAYDAVGNQVSVTDALGHTTHYTYDDQNRKTSQTDALGKTTTYAYDGAGNLVSTTDPLGGHATSTYDAVGRVTSRTDALGRTTSYAYDGAGRLLNETLPNGGRLSFSYDAGGRKTGSTDALGQTTHYAYDSVGRLTSTTDPLGNVTRQVYDVKGRLTQTIDALGHTTTYTFDSLDHSLSVTDPTGATIGSAYDAAGHLTSSTNAVGGLTSYAYDAAGRQLSITDPLGRATTFAYDAIGQISSQRLPSGSSTTYTYDAAGHRTSITDGIGDRTSLTFDTLGRPATQSDARGGVTTFGYDALGRRVSSTDALGGTIQTTYDATGQETSVTNPRGDTVRHTYDAVGDIVTTTDPAGGVTTYTYDAAGHRLSATDARGIQVTYSYDVTGNQTGISYPTGAITSVYDGLGQRTSMTDATGTTASTYNAAGRLTSVASPEGTVAYAYDTAGRPSAMTLPGARQITYAYDGASQLTALTDWLGLTTTFNYSGDGLRTAIHRPNGVATTYAYDGADRLASVNHDGPGGALLHLSYTLDANGNRTALTSGAGTETYALDALNRVTQAHYTNGDTVGYSYDAAGNRTSETVNSAATAYTYSAAGRLVSAGATNFTYDAAGNLATAGAATFAYDWADRLIASTTAGVSTAYTYDGTGLRVGMTGGGVTSSYVWDRSRGLPALLDDGAHGFVQVQGPLEQIGPGASAAFLLGDAVGSVRGVSDAAGSLSGSASYDIFGAVRAPSGTASTLGFAGEQTDAATGFSYLRARYLNPVIGRFLTPDSVQPNADGSQGYNLYSYGGNNPTTMVDPSGQTITEFVITVATRVAAFARVVTAAEQAATDAEEAAMLARFLASRAALEGVARPGIDWLVVALYGALGTGTILCVALCGPATTTEPTQAPTPEAPPTAAPAPEPVLPDTKDRRRVGQIVYRVFDTPRGRWNGESWTPVNPAEYGSQMYRVVAGLPDVQNTGNCLVTGILLTLDGVTPRASLPMDPPNSYRKYPGGLPEYVITNAALKVGLPVLSKLDPPYGGDPDNPPSHTADCSF